MVIARMIKYENQSEIKIIDNILIKFIQKSLYSSHDILYLLFLFKYIQYSRNQAKNLIIS